MSEYAIVYIFQDILWGIHYNQRDETMPNPLGSIIPILDLLGKELKIPPATGGVFPPYEGLRKKLTKARNFQEAFKLRPQQIR